MIYLEDFIIKIVPRQNSKYPNKTKYFRCDCSQCGKSKGYQKKSRYKNKPLCIKCSTNTKEHKQNLINNHWSKTGKYSPKIYVTEEEIRQKRERELEHNRKYYKKYYQENKIKIHNRRKNRLKNSINLKLACNLRSRLYLALKNNYKTGSAIRDLGCSIEGLKRHLESQFTEGMSWDNYGRKGWHIDHIKPLSIFNLEDCGEFKKACHYTNLQPLWAKDNLKKGSKFHTTLDPYQSEVDPG